LAGFGFDGRTHGHETALGTGNGTLDQQQLTGFVDADHVEVLGGHGVIAQMTGHALARKHATRILRHTDRARHIVRTAVTVRRTLRAHVWRLMVPA
jgi:hypothetical protein